MPEGEAGTAGASPAERAALAARLRAAGCVFAEDEAQLILETAVSPRRRDELVERRIGGEPLEYLLGWVDFCGHRVAVRPGVFIPRQRTEFLVRTAAALTQPGSVVLDLCCGSGAIGIALSRLVADIELHASDCDPDAAECARANLAAVGGHLHASHVYLGNLFDPLPSELRRSINTITANVPYVPTDAIALMPHEAQDHEKRVAIDGGIDGLDVLRRVAHEAQEWLAPGGRVFVEVYDDQADAAVDNFARGGLEAHAVSSEELEATVVVATG